MNRRFGKSLWLGAVIIIVCSFLIIMVVYFAQSDETPKIVSDNKAVKTKEESVHIGREIKLAQQTRRVPVTGASGFFIIIEPDGSTFMEDADGKRTQLTNADPKEAPNIDDTVSSIMNRIDAVPKKTAIGELIVCDKGIVDVPKGSIITFIGPDKVVTHSNDGASVTYFTDGRIVRRSRLERKIEGNPLKN